MNSDYDFHLTPDDNEGQFELKKPCSLLCDTAAGQINLIIDLEKPIFLFVEIEDEIRRCYDLKNYALQFESEKDAVYFLKNVQESRFFKKIVEDEIALNREWDAL